ncbi:hypothetical protein ACI78V_04225 [Geodermatophilus sp. SYSU D00742]
MTGARLLLPVLAGAALLTTGCAERAAPGAPAPPTGAQPFVSRQPVPQPEPVPPVPDALPPELLEGVTPMPLELLTFQNRLHELFGDSPDLGATSAAGRPSEVVVRWHGDPPAGLLALVERYADAPFQIRVEQTRFRPGDLLEEARRLLEQHPGVVTGTGPRTEGDGVVVGIAPAVDPDPGPEELATLGITSRFPLFPEAVEQPVPAAG